VTPRQGSALALALLVGLAAAVAAAAPVPPRADELAADVAALAAPEMEGRGSGTGGGDRAARYIADRLAALGLRPGGDDGGYLQAFPVSVGVRAGADTRLERDAPGGIALVPGRDFVPHGGAPAADVAGEALVLGRGGYAGADARDRIVLAPAAPDRPASRLEQLIEARRRGAAALLLVGDALPPLEATGAAVRLPSATVTPAAARALLGPAGSALDGPAGWPAGPVDTGVRVRLRVALEREARRAANVIGVLPGTDPGRAAEAVVLGAHYDHLGRVGGAVHPGADDNASGTAVVLGLARAFAAAGGAPRTLVFALFSGEELGLLGSTHYTRHPAVPLDRTVAMLNVDMVGRLGDGRLAIGGVESATGLRALVTRAAGDRAALSDSPHGPSDHAALYAAGVPAVSFHTGTHADYHEPTDTADKVDAAGLAQVAAIGARLAALLAGEPRPAYARVEAPAGRGRDARMSGAPGDAFLGVSVRPGPGTDGLALASIVPGSAAARAGLRAGDVLVRLDAAPLGRFEDLRRVLAAKRPGDPVAILFLRDGQDLEATATLDARP
jgi:hypothetical protein